MVTEPDRHSAERYARRARGVAAPVATAEAKRTLRQKTGAVAVDMESHIVASVALKHAIPMAAIRVITDPAGRAAQIGVGAMRPDGSTDFAAMMHHLFKNPWELPTILRTALDARAARAHADARPPAARPAPRPAGLPASRA
jgi:hypothetical protein